VRSQPLFERGDRFLQLSQLSRPLCENLWSGLITVDLIHKSLKLFSLTEWKAMTAPEAEASVGGYTFTLDGFKPEQVAAS
jgi:hypothetical protein